MSDDLEHQLVQVLITGIESKRVLYEVQAKVAGLIPRNLISLDAAKPKTLYINPSFLNG